MHPPPHICGERTGEGLVFVSASGKRYSTVNGADVTVSRTPSFLA